MKEILMWLAGIVIIITMLWTVVNEYNKKQSRTIKEYQKDIEEQGLNKIGISMMRAGFLEMEKVVKPELQNAIEFMEDEKSGKTESKRKEGDDPD